MLEYKRDTAFLRQLIHLDDTEERLQLVEEIDRVQRDEHCVKRAASLMVLLLSLSLAGLGYATIMIENFPYGESNFFFKILCVLGLTSIMSLPVLFGLLIFYRWKSNRLRENCRRLITKLLHPSI